MAQAAQTLKVAELSCRAELAPWHARLLSLLAAATAEQDANAAISYIGMAIEASRGASDEQLVGLPSPYRMMRDRSFGEYYTTSQAAATPCYSYMSLGAV